MGCASSSDAGNSPASATPATSGNTYESVRRSTADDPAEVAKSSGIDRDLDRARQQEEGKVKLLLLGAGESGKSTIFKQMRILHGSPRSDDDLRMYGVVIRSNIIVAMRKLCAHLRSLGLEDALSAEPIPDDFAMTPKQAYDELISHLVDNTALCSEESPQNGDSNTNPRDWVGQSPRAGLAANNDAKLFLQLVDAIRVLWQVSLDLDMTRANVICIWSFRCITLTTPPPSAVKNNEGSMVKACRCERYR
jgi:G-protein alpha subunit